MNVVARSDEINRMIVDVNASMALEGFKQYEENEL